MSFLKTKSAALVNVAELNINIFPHTKIDACLQSTQYVYFTAANNNKIKIYKIQFKQRITK